jgi:hypothetical protein
MEAGPPPTLDDGASVRDLDLLQLALGLQSPWRVERSEFDATAKRLDLYIDVLPGGTFAWPECGGQGW